VRFHGADPLFQGNGVGGEVEGGTRREVLGQMLGYFGDRVALVQGDSLEQLLAETQLVLGGGGAVAVVDYA
jgi:hypothetical protein